jgi:sodium/potassium-transporting ATPase subunit alpha
MRVTDCLVGKESMSVGEAVQLNSQSQSSDKTVPEDSAVGKLALLAGLCNEADFDPTTTHLPLSERKINGNATDQAVLRFAESVSPIAGMKQRWRTDFRLAFNSKNKFMINVASPVWAADAKTPASEQPTLMIKGAPDILLPRCATYLSQEGHPVDLYESDRKAIEAVKDDWSSQGKRVILIACKVLPEWFSALNTATRAYEQAVLDEATQDLELVGLVGIVDPPREEIPGVISTLRDAGIKIHMVTGDFKLTAQAIASTCGIITNPKPLIDDVSALSTDEKFCKTAYNETRAPRSIVLSGPELVSLDDDQWNRLCRYDEIVFARTTPEQKLRIVKEFKARNETVGSKYQASLLAKYVQLTTDSDGRRRQRCAFAKGCRYWYRYGLGIRHCYRSCRYGSSRLIRRYSRSGQVWSSRIW